jgi:hypothetical protein
MWLALILLGCAAFVGWSTFGGRLLAAVNPALTRLIAEKPSLNAWIMPPEYVNMSPVMMMTPAGLRHQGDVIEVPEGSTFSAHLADRGGSTPVMTVSGARVAFVTDRHGDYAAESTLVQGGECVITRGNRVLGRWQVRVVPDLPPQIALVAAPAVTQQQKLLLTYRAADHYGVTSVIAHITPRDADGNDTALDIPLVRSGSAPASPMLARADEADLTAHAWAGHPVRLQLIAINTAGRRAESDPVDIMLPERAFVSPVARVLAEARRQLLLNPEDATLRNEAAAVMAEIARNPAPYQGDPLVALALRSGAVRLVLDHSHAALNSVDDLLWETALHVEERRTAVAGLNTHAQPAPARDHEGAIDDKALGEQGSIQIKVLPGALPPTQAVRAIIDDLHRRVGYLSHR